jgi:RNA polymerase sigma-70 factor (ECF subfamily)
MPALEAALLGAVGRGQGAHSGLPADWEAFAAFLAERVPAEVDPVQALDKLHIEDLYLAWACARGDPVALATFERSLTAVPKWLSSLRPESELTDEVKQALREKLFLGGGGPPKILQYSGEGALEKWLKMATLRTALDLIDARRAGRLPDEIAVAVGAAQYEPELDFIKERYRDDFSAAFREAFAQLPERTRALLRFQHLERLSPERIGAIYSVHRTTAARWLAEAHQQVLDGTRSRLMSRLKLSERECESLLDLLNSRLAVTLHSLFDSAPGE